MLIRGLILAAVAVLVLLAAGSTRATPGASAQGDTQGDVTCDSSVNAVDSLQILRDVAGLGTTAGCLAGAGDVNCDTAVNSVDALRILRYVAGLFVAAPDGCAPIGDPLGPPTPQVLAARLHAAPDADHAEALLRLVYPEIDVGLYTADGQQIIAGAETGLDDFYLYDFESDLLAGNYAERQMYGLDTAVVFLGEAGVVDGNTGQPFTDAGLLPVMAAKVAAARGDQSMFAWRLIDELGLAREQQLDLTTPGLGPADIYLDSVQTFLVLYDMTLGQPASLYAFGEGVSAADAPDARTEALHDYSLLAQGYSGFLPGIEETHWKHGTGQAENQKNRKVQIFVEFKPGPDVPDAIVSGPLKGVKIPDAGGVPGAALDWFPDDQLRRNGHMEQRPERLITDSNGYAYDNFIPRPECPWKIGVGEEVEEVGSITVTVQVQVTSRFAPFKVLGSFSSRASVEITVSHHDGKASQSNGGAASFASPAVADPAPCAYEGTATATVRENNADANSEVVVNATGLRFEALRSTDSGSLLYNIAAGAVTVEQSGTLFSCALSGGSTVTLGEETDLQDLTGIIEVSPDHGYRLDGVVSDYGDPGLRTCEDPFLGTVEFEMVYYELYMKAPPTLGADWEPATDFQSISGSRDDDIGNGVTVHFEWSFHAAECNPSPEPVCTSARMSDLAESPRQVR